MENETPETEEKDLAPEGAHSEETESSEEETDAFESVMAALDERLAPKETKTVSFEKYETVLKQRNELLEKVQKLVINKDLTVSGQTKTEAQKTQEQKESAKNLFGISGESAKELSYADLYKMIKN